MKNTLLFSLLLAIPAHSFTTYHPYYHHSSYSSSKNMPDWAVGALVIGGAVLAGIGIYKLIDWLSTRTDEQIIQDVENAVKNAKHSYQADIDLMHNLGITSNTHTHESSLYEFAYSWWLAKESGSSRLHNLTSTVDKLHGEHKVILERLHKLDQTRNKDMYAQTMYAQMLQTVKRFDAVLSQLELLNAYLRNHASYFGLYDTEAWLLSRYDSHLKVYNQYAYDRYAYESLLRQEIFATGRQQDKLYPYLVFANQIGQDIKTLKIKIKEARNDYFVRLSEANGLLARLEYIYKSVVADPEYAQEQRAYEVAEREREKAARERERLALEQQKVRELQNQTRALHEQNKQLRLQNKLQRKRYCAACCPKNSCVICELNDFFTAGSCSCGQPARFEIEIKATI